MRAKILDRYIGFSVAFSILLALLVLLALFVFFTFMEELDEIGRGDYGYLQALQYMLLRMPTIIYQLFPVSALLGSIIGLGALAGNSELVVMRAAGVSIGRIVWSVMKVGVVLMVIATVLGEAVAPIAELQAERLRADALSAEISMQGGEGMWARDGLSFINIKNTLPGGRIGDVYIIELDEQHRVKRITHGDHGVFENSRWRLDAVWQAELQPAGAQSRQLGHYEWRSSLTPEMLGVVKVKPEALAVWGLYQYIDYLRNNGLDAARYEMAFWGKLVAPLVLVTMVFVAVPFVFGPLRSVGVGSRILVGALVGIGFHLFNQTVNYLGLVYAFNPVLSATLPTLLFLALAIWLMRRVY